MKHFAYLLNIGWLLWFGLLLIDKGLPSGKELLFVLIAIVTLVINTVVLMRLSETKESWLALLLQRKALEEKRKIVSIQDDLKK